MESGVLIQIIVTVGSIAGGFFAVIRYAITSFNSMQQNFLKHLELKNGHNERIANKYAESDKEVAKALNFIKEEIAKTRDREQMIKTSLSQAASTIEKNTEVISVLKDKIKHE